MKRDETVKFVSLFLVLISSSLAFASPPAEKEGSKGGGGGEVIAADFVRYAQYTVRAMKWGKDDRVRTYSVDETAKIETAISTVQVFAGPSELFCKSYQDVMTGDIVRRCEDAHYDPIKREIWVNQDRWLKHPCSRKMDLVLHEYGRVAGLENASYAFSSKARLDTHFQDMCTRIYDTENVEIEQEIQRGRYCK